MDDLILRRLSGRATDLEAHRVDQWRRASDANERTYGEMRAVWDVVGAAPLGEVAPAPGVEAVVAEAERRRGRVLRGPWRLGGAGESRPGGFRYAVVAAVVVGLAGAGVLWHDRAAVQPLTPTGSSTMAGDVTTMTLSDGSVVRLAASTRLTFPAGAADREVVLDGRAFFAVAPGTVPFVVRTDVGRVTVHGTRFEVRTAGPDLRLIVVEGRVLVEGDGGSTVVSSGEIAYLRRGGSPRVVERADVWSLLDWPDGVLLFQETPLDEVGREVGARFRRTVQVDSAVASRRVTAWFEDESLDEVVSSVCLVAGVRCVIGDSLVSMEGR